MWNRLANLPSLNLPATLRMRFKGQSATVFRRTQVRAEGAVRTFGHLRVGCQWPSSTDFQAGYLHVAPGGTLEVHGDFRLFTGFRIVVDQGARLSLGSGYLNYGSRISCFTEVHIGKDTAIAEEVIIRDSDNHAIVGSNRPMAAPIHIGDHVWIGMRSMILKGVTIGNGAVVAAGSVVVEDVPAHTLVAGVPATVRRDNVSWE